MGVEHNPSSKENICRSNSGTVLPLVSCPKLPVVSFEGAVGKEVPVATGRTRVVVFYASTGQLKTGYFGVLTQGFPQLVRVNRDVLKLEAKDGWPEDAPVLCRVRMINEFPMIPDLEKLEAMLATESLQA